MKILWSWLGELLSASCTPQQAASALTESGTETIVLPAFSWAQDLAVAYVQDCQPHPSSDHLSLCEVLCHGQNFQVVCGAGNVRKGLKTVLIRPGQKLPGSSEPLAPAVIRGVASQGMLCSATELCVEDLFGDNGGILEVDDSVEVSTPFSALLPEDFILEAEITPNRGDLLSLLGIARELVAMDKGKLKPFPHLPSMTLQSFEELSIQTDLCHQLYMAKATGAASVAGSSLIKRRLDAVGQKSVFPLIDRANYWSHMWGTPFHVFDRQKLVLPLTLTLSQDKEDFQALDGQTYSLPQGLLVLKDQKGIVALPGVMGALRGSCKKDTDEIWVESAVFDPDAVSIAGQKTHILSQSRSRFERGVDPAQTLPQLSHFLNFLNLPHTLHQASALGAKPCIYKPIFFSSKDLENSAGCQIVGVEIEKRLSALGCQVHRISEDSWEVTPPSWRHDVSLVQDLVEEVLRLKSYQEVPCVFQRTASPLKPLPQSEERLWQARDFLIAKDLKEVMTWSLISKEKAALFSQGLECSLDDLALDYPLSKEMALLRPSLFPGILGIAMWHRNQKVHFDGVFETGLRFTSPLPCGQKSVVAGFVPLKRKGDWCGQSDVSFYDMKGLLQGVLRCWKMFDVTFKGPGPSFTHPGQSAFLQVQGVSVGFLGRLHPKLPYDVDGWLFQLEAEVLLEYQAVVPEIMRSDLQPVKKDLSFLLPADRQAGPFLKGLEEAGQPDLVAWVLKDVFQAPEGRSLTIECIFQPLEQTFSDQKLHTLMDRLIQWASAQGAVLRGEW